MARRERTWRDPVTHVTAPMSAWRALLRHLDLSDPTRLGAAIPTKPVELRRLLAEATRKEGTMRKSARKSRAPSNAEFLALYPKIPMAGALVVEHKRCGRSPCRCESGELHGPYYRLRWHEGASLRSRYVPAAHVPWVSEGVFLRRMIRRCRRPSGVRRVLAALRRLERETAPWR